MEDLLPIRSTHLHAQLFKEQFVASSELCGPRMIFAVAACLGRFYTVELQEYLMQRFVLEPASKLLFKLVVLLIG